MPSDEIHVYASTHNSGRCRGCSARVTWYQTARGRWVPFNGEPVPLRHERDPLAAPGRRLRYVLAGRDVHLRTCPDSAAFSRRRLIL